MENDVINFRTAFNDECMAESKKNNLDITSAFKQTFISYLVENGETSLSDLDLISFKKDSLNIKLDGYKYVEYFNSLTLLISKYDPKLLPEKIGKTEIDKNLKKAEKFFRMSIRSELDGMEGTDDGYQAYQDIKALAGKVETVQIIFITNDIVKNYIPDDKSNKQMNIRFDVFDIERLYQIVMMNNYQEKELKIKLKNKYKQVLPMIKVPGDNPVYDCYIGAMPGRLLAEIYHDEGQILIQKNVRSFLQATGKINKGIKNTLSKEPEMFMAYNNGISTIADSIIADKTEGGIYNIREMDGWQIINGGQTTASIFNAYDKNKASLDQVYVQIKLSVIKDQNSNSEIAKNISKYANSQNKINMSDFNANDDFHIKMEQISRNTFIPVEKGKATEQWFYERARGQYLVELHRKETKKEKDEFKQRIPKSRCVSKTVAAKCVMAYLGYPDIVSKGLETNFVYFSQKIAEGEIPQPSQESYIDMICKVILFNDCDKIVDSQNFRGYKAQINYYTIALVGRYFKDKFDREYIWKNQVIPGELAEIIEELSHKVFDHFQHPSVPGVNITQWCKKKECWDLLIDRYENNEFVK